jgi:hypothetical protein
MSDWQIRRNPDDKNSWAFNVYTNEVSPQDDNSVPFLQATLYSKKKVTVFVEEGQDVYPNPTVNAIDEATEYNPPSMENLSKTTAIEDDLEAVAAAVGAFVEAGTTFDSNGQLNDELPTQQIQPPEFIKFPSGEIIP